MVGIKAREIAYVRLSAPDLDTQERFLTAFGLLPAERSDTRLYMRGTDPAQYIHVTELGEPKVLGFGWHAASADDLEVVAAHPDAISAIEAIDGPGGGRRVRLQDPNGYLAEVVHGIADAGPVEVSPRQMNDARAPLNRKGVLMRTRPGPSQVKRIAHGVFFTPKFAETLAWYRKTLGFIGSDDLYVDDPSNVVASFNRCDAGEAYVDHHSFFTMANDRCGLNHVSFEVQDLDDVQLGHDHLKQSGYTHVWGIGRHVPGSQIFDYWEDPWGRVHEHWTDSDRLNVSNGTNLVPIAEGLASQWGEAPPQRFIGYVTP